jgi:hypothetical protein
MSFRVRKEVMRPEGQLAVQVPHWKQSIKLSPPWPFWTASAKSAFGSLGADN